MRGTEHLASLGATPNLDMDGMTTLSTFDHPTRRETALFYQYMVDLDA
jgi:hypothetical protein